LGIIDYSTNKPNDLDEEQPVKGSKPLVPGLSLEDLDRIDTADGEEGSGSHQLNDPLAMDPAQAEQDLDDSFGAEDDDQVDSDDDDHGDGIGRGVDEADYVKGDKVPLVSPAAPTELSSSLPSTAVPIPIPATPTEKTARCKSCGATISRDIEAIEQHIEECPGRSMTGRSASTIVGSFFQNRASLAIDGMTLGATAGPSKTLAGLARKPDLETVGTRILYRTARPQSKVYAPREVCVLQDSFVDPQDGACYVYEVSVRHCDVHGMPGYVTADVLLLMHVARPVKGSKNMCNITIISQVDTRVKGPQWLLSFITEEGANDIGVVGRDDLVR
jgi:hypothetical protein